MWRGGGVHVAGGVARASQRHGFCSLAVAVFERMASAWGAAERLPITAQPLIDLSILQSGIWHGSQRALAVTAAAGGDRALAYCMKYPRGEQL